MLKSLGLKIRTNIIFQIIAIATVVASLIGVCNVATAKEVNAASIPVSINLIYYGQNSSTTDQGIIDANPEYLVDNSSAGPWQGNADISTFMAAGIKYFEYIDGGYEGTVSRAIPNDLQSNLDYIDAIAKAGAYGVFVDEVSPSPSTAALDYLKQLADRAHSLGLKVVFNTGVDSWSDSLMAYCDFINSSEVWNNDPLTASQTKWQSRTWFLTQGVNDAATAANLTNAAWSKGIAAEYACSTYTALPTWLADYITLVEPSSTAAVVPTSTTTTTAAVVPTTTTTTAVVPTTMAAVVPTTTTTTTTAVVPTTMAAVAAAPATMATTAVAPTTMATTAATTTTTAMVAVAPTTTATVPTTPATTATVVTTSTTTTTTAATPTTTATVAVVPTTTAAVAAAPTTMTAVAAAPTTTTTAATTPTTVSGNAIIAFFLRLWQPVLVVWDHISGWMGI